MKKLLAAFLIATSAISTSAATIRYTLQDAKFTNGMTASGSFVWDTETHQAASQSLRTDLGSSDIFDDITFDQIDYTFGGAISVKKSSTSGVWKLLLETNDNFNLAGKYFLNLTSNSSFFASSGPYVNQVGTVYVTSGYVIADGFNDPADVPEPAMLGLLGFGVMGLGLSRSRKA